ncbi:hypothetical protein Val02_87160 [Virgisporangium aliadipatigenens]|uniref:Uncharacterized protein n=1 Tax=Virgisporangium aliadipatigenens TaxID=741659 RepID=A0A8J3YY41_9ACTN|nr:hypothetical protein [Virgisporangium aliadipatigenens]GIJ51830.1 hypothetical protein Val02_87160 [Virgisporangium aliadipatigenens]
MAFNRGRYRTAASTATLVAFILVLIFGSPWYRDWVDDTDRGLFLTTLAWPAWTFDDDLPLRDLLAANLKAILLIAFTYGFVSLMAGSQLSRARGGISAFLVGWAAYMFAAALAAFLTWFIAASAPADDSVVAATGGTAYGLIVGWIVGLASMAGRRP